MKAKLNCTTSWHAKMIADIELSSFKPPHYMEMLNAKQPTFLMISENGESSYDGRRLTFSLCQRTRCCMMMNTPLAPAPSSPMTWQQITMMNYQNALSSWGSLILQLCFASLSIRHGSFWKFSRVGSAFTKIYYKICKVAKKLCGLIRWINLRDPPFQMARWSRVHSHLCAASASHRLLLLCLLSSPNLPKPLQSTKTPEKNPPSNKNYSRCHHIYSMHKRESEQTTHEIVERRIPI